MWQISYMLFDKMQWEECSITSMLCLRKIKLDTLPKKQKQKQKQFCNPSKYQDPESQEKKTKDRGKLKRHN